MKIIFIIGLVTLILSAIFIIWVLCKAAILAEKIEEDIYRNYFGEETNEHNEDF